MEILISVSADKGELSFKVGKTVVYANLSRNKSDTVANLSLTSGYSAPYYNKALIPVTFKGDYETLSPKQLKDTVAALVTPALLARLQDRQALVALGKETRQNPWQLEYKGTPVYFSVFLNYQAFRIDIHLEKKTENLGKVSVDVATPITKLKSSTLQKVVTSLVETYLAANGLRKLKSADKKLKDLMSSVADREKKDAAATQRRDAQKKAKGFNFKLAAWIHPEHGDDFPQEWYMVDKPTKAAIVKLLRQAGSVSVDDYKVSAL